MIYNYNIIDQYFSKKILWLWCGKTFGTFWWRVLRYHRKRHRFSVIGGCRGRCSQVLLGTSSTLWALVLGFLCVFRSSFLENLRVLEFLRSLWCVIGKIWYEKRKIIEKCMKKMRMPFLQQQNQINLFFFNSIYILYWLHCIYLYSMRLSFYTWGTNIKIFQLN